MGVPFGDSDSSQPPAESPEAGSAFGEHTIFIFLSTFIAQSSITRSPSSNLPWFAQTVNLSSHFSSTSQSSMKIVQHPDSP